MGREDWMEASERWGELRRVFLPNQVSGYKRGAAALRKAGRLEEAEALASEAVSRYPDGPDGCVQRDEVAMRRENLASASEYGRTRI